MKSRTIHIARKKIVSIGVIVLVSLGVLVVLYPEVARGVYEVVSTRLFPNADREFAYGERHFDTYKPEAYSIDLAEYFFRQAEKHDPKIPYLYHEIARVDFLKGNLHKALIEINIQIQRHGDKTPNSYYIRGLIEGYIGDYVAAAKDYERYLQFDPTNWAAINDYAWVLLKAERYTDAERAIVKGLTYFPDNPWLLNSYATALFELGKHERALVSAKKAQERMLHLTEGEWSRAYPGNDPEIAGQGVSTFRTAVEANVRTIEAAIASSTKK